MMFSLPGILNQNNTVPENLTLAVYCPQDITGFYDINFSIIPQQTLGNYCPQTITGFYDINFSSIPQQTLANYCPQTITGFYTLAYDPANPPLGVTTHYAIGYTNLLSEIKVSIDPNPNTPLVLDASNNITFSIISGTPAYNVGALNDNIISTTNNQYIGNLAGQNGGYVDTKLIFSTPVTIKKIYIAPQAYGGIVYNAPGQVSLYYSTNNGASWSNIQNWFSPTVTGSSYTELVVTNTYS